MQVNTTKNNGELLIDVEGRIDTNSAPQLEEELSALDEAIKKVIFDLEKVAYISSSGLRVIISALKKTRKQNAEVIVRKPQPMVLDIIEATGIDEMVTIEE